MKGSDSIYFMRLNQYGYQILDGSPISVEDPLLREDCCPTLKTFAPKPHLPNLAHHPT